VSSREQILNRLRTAAAVPSDLPAVETGVKARLDAAWDAAFPVGHKRMAGVFAQALEAVSGEFYAAASAEEAAEIVGRVAASANYQTVALDGSAFTQAVAARLPESLSPQTLPEGPQRAAVMKDVPLALVEAQWGVAETATVAFSYLHSESTQPHFLAETVVVLLKKERLLPHLKALFGKLSPKEQRDLVLVTGPSRTADIEKILILGAHGPKRLVVILLG